MSLTEEPTPLERPRCSFCIVRYIINSSARRNARVQYTSAHNGHESAGAGQKEKTRTTTRTASRPGVPNSAQATAPKYAAGGMRCRCTSTTGLLSQVSCCDGVLPCELCTPSPPKFFANGPDHPELLGYLVRLFAQQVGFVWPRAVPVIPGPRCFPLNFQ